MAKISRFIQLSDNICLEYISDVNNMDYEKLSDRGAYSVLGRNGTKQYVEVNNDENNLLGIPNTVFYDNKNEAIYTDRYNTLEELKEKQVILDYKKIEDYVDGTPSDTIRIHFLTSYILHDEGMLLRLSGTDKLKRNVPFINFYINKQRFYDVIKFNAKPLYIASKFFDRYIEFKIPSIYYIGLINSNKELVDDNTIYSEFYFKLLSNLTLDFTMIDESTNYEVLLDKHGSYYGFSVMNPSKYITTHIPMLSNADNFNIYLREDAEKGFIEYYATWGDAYVVDTKDKKPKVLGQDIMNMLEDGRIPMYFGPEENKNLGWEDFTQVYGADARKWVVIHELILTEMYGNVTDNNKVKFTSTNIFTETYDDELSQTTTDQYKYKFRPVVGEYSRNLNLDSLDVTYNCRLLNRLDGTQIIRSGSISILDPRPKFGVDRKKIDISNMSKYSIFNKNVVNTITQEAPVINTKPRYIREFYNVNEILVKADTEGSYVAEGYFNLNVYRYTRNYKLKFSVNDTKTNMTKPLDLSGPYTYYLVTKDINGNEIKITPTHSANMNMVSGELEFKITEEVSGRMFKVPSNNRIYAIICENSDGSKISFVEGYIV